MADLNLDYLWVQKSDFTDFRDISANIKDETLNIFIREAQFLDVKKFLGKELYSLMQLDWNDTLKEFVTPKYNDLWFGVGDFNGYMNASIYYSYARFLLQQQVNVSRFGVESIQNEISEDVSNAQIRSKTNDARKVALRYEEETIDFLGDHTSDYSEFKENEVNKNRTAFSFFKL